MALNMGQWLSIPFIVVGIIMIVRSYKMTPGVYFRETKNNP
jgi:prolipoprotein diacylglyceryltransferase